MAEKYLHIVSLRPPLPPDIGSAFDLFYKIVALSKAGIGIHLHCFGEPIAKEELLQWCETVDFYPRITGPRSISFRLPYIVSSRNSRMLRERLLADDHPILMEGIHSTDLLGDARLAARKTMLRLHNTEYIYYRKLYESSHSLFKKIYYWQESRLLKKYERWCAGRTDVIATVSMSDTAIYRTGFGAANVEFVPVFVPFEKVDIADGRGEYCLYHGNLAVAENAAAASWLIKDVFSSLQVPLLIAGRGAPGYLRKLADHQPRCQLTDDPGNEQLEELIRNAQCHVLPSFNATGVKLKVVNALFHGRHCIVNHAAVAGSGMDALCVIAGDAESFSREIETAFHRSFTEEDISKRKDLLENLFNPSRNAESLIRMLW